MNFEQALLLILPERDDMLPWTTNGNVRPGRSRGYYASDLSVHAGVDFNYNEQVWLDQQPKPNTLAWSNGPVNQGHPPVLNPVSGTLVFRSPGLQSVAPGGVGGGDGGVFIKDGMGVVHGFLHLDSLSDTLKVAAIGSQIAAGTVLGYMGGREGGNPTARAIHVHYATYLNFDPATASGNKIDPIIYWTQGVNPTPGASTGLTVLVTPVNDIDGNGVIGTGTLSGLTASENGAVVKEGESSFLRLGVNTPHTQPIVLRIGFTQPTPNLDIRGVGAVTVNSNNLADYGVAYVTLPATQNQGIPNTSGFIELVGLEDADNTTSESYSYTVTAGYFDSVGNFFAYGANVFTGTSGHLFVLDNDTPQAPPDIDTPNAWIPIGQNTVDQRNGTDQDDCTGTTGFADPDGDGDNDLGDIQGTGAAEHIDGQAGRDMIWSQGGDDVILGGDDADIVNAGDGADRLYGGAELDLMTALAQGRTATGTGRQGDWLNGARGDDLLISGADNDVLFGGEGRDTLVAGAGNDTLAGDDDYTATSLAWTVTNYGNPFDRIFSPNQNNNANPPVGDSDVLYGGAGNDFLAGEAGDDVLFGEDGNDTISGNDDNDTLSGGAGDDIMTGDYGQLAYDGSGAEVIQGDDVLDGGAGDDWMQGEAGADRLFGGADDDTLIGDAAYLPGDQHGNDYLDGGAGRDWLYGDGGNDTYYFARGYGSDDIIDSGGTDIVRLGAGILPRNEDVKVGQTSSEGGAALTLAIGSDVLTIWNWWYVTGRVEYVQFDDGTIWDQTVLSQKSGLGTETANTLTVADLDIYQAGEVDGINVFARLFGFDGDDTLTGSEFADELQGGNGSDRLDGAGGADTLVGGLGGDTYVVDNVNDYVHELENEGTDTVESSVSFGLATNVENLTLIGTAAINGAGNSLANVISGNDYVNYLWGSSTSDPSAPDAADTLDGQQGNDVLDGGAGDDTYIFRNGDGKDRITDTVGTHHLLFADGVTSGDVYVDIDDYIQATNNLIVRYSALDQVTLGTLAQGGAFTLELADGTSYGYAVQTGGSGDDTLTGGDGSDLIVANEGSDVLSGGAGNDSLFGKAGDDTLNGGRGNDLLAGDVGYDTYLFERGDGQDLIREKGERYASYDVLRFGPGIARADLVISGRSNDLIIAIAGTGDSVTVDDWFYFDNRHKLEELQFAVGESFYIGVGIQTGLQFVNTGTDRNDSLSADECNATTLIGLAGNDDLLGGTTQDTLDGGAGDDTLNGGQGNDTYVFARGYGRDTIGEIPGYLQSWSNPGNDRVEFRGLNRDEVDFSRTGNDLVITVRGTEDVLTIRQWWYTFTSRQIEQLVFADGTIRSQDVNLMTLPVTGSSAADTLYAGPTNDEIAGLDGNDVIDGGPGNDTLLGDAGNDALRGGFGNDILRGGDDNDTLESEDGDDFLSGGAGNDIMSGGEGADTLDGGAGNDTLYCNGGGDTVLFGRNSGYDTAYVRYGDRVVFGADVSAGDITLSRSYYDLILAINGTSDRLKIGDWFRDSEYRGAEFVFADGSTLPGAPAIYQTFLTYVGSEGADSMLGNDDNELIRGLGGDDSINGNGGSDTLDGGDGNDVLSGGGHLIGGVGSDRLYAASNTTLDGGTGNDYLEGWGNATYVFGRGYGQDTIRNTKYADAHFTKDGCTDRVVFTTGTTAADIVLGRTGNDLTLLISGTTDSLTIQNWFLSTDNRVDRFEFTDGTCLPSPQEITDALSAGIVAEGTAITGTADADVLSGTTAPETLYGQAGDDILAGGSGDLLVGGAGSDSYRFSRGDGQVAVNDYNPQDARPDVYGPTDDRVVFGTGISVGDLVLSRSGDSLVIQIDGTSDQLTIRHWFAGPSYQVGFTFEDGSNLPTPSQIYSNLLAVAGTPANDLLKGYEGDDQVSGANGDDTIYGGTGNDVLQGGDGIDRLYGESGNDTLTGGAGNDLLYGYAGEDVLDGGTGSDQLWGGAENDMLDGGAGDTATDSLHGGTGDDTYVFGIGSGVDTILDENTNSDRNRVVFGTGISASNIFLSRAGQDLVLRVAGTSDQLQISQWFFGERYQRYEFVFLDGSSLPGAAEITESIRTQTGTANADALSGFATDDVLWGMAGNDALQGGSGRDVLHGGDDNDALDGGPGNDTLLGEGGGDTLLGTSGDDLLDGGMGDDTLTGGAGNDTYVFGLGYGHDTIDDFDAQDADPYTYGLHSDRMAFGAGIAANNLEVMRNNNDLVIHVNASDSVTITGWFTGNVVEQFSFENGTTLTAAQMEARIGVPPGNNPPTLAAPLADQAATEDTPFVATLPADTFTDVDGDALTLGATRTDGSALPAWLTFDAATRTFSGTPTNSDVGTLAIRVTATDPGGASVFDDFTLAVANTNDVPVLANPLADQSGTEGAAFSYGVAANAFADVDAGDTLTYSAALADGSPLPGWLTFEPATRTFSGTPGSDAAGSYSVRVIATDGAGASISDTFLIDIAAAPVGNQPPVLAAAIPDQPVLEDSVFSFQVPAATFSDPDAGDTLTYAATRTDGSGLPAWLSFDPATRTFSGTPANGDVGVVPVRVTATDTSGATVSDDFDLTVQNVNDAPVLASALADQTATEDAPYTFTVPANTFTDADVGDTLSYTATRADSSALPAWLSFDAVTRTFSGTPTNGDVGSVDVRVTATDGSGASASDVFALSVANVNDAPGVPSRATTLTEDWALMYTQGTLLEGAQDIDPTGDTLAIVSAGNAQHGNVTLDAWHNVQFIPDANYNGPASFDYTVTDGQGGLTTATVTIAVQPENDTPVVAATIADQTVAWGDAFTFTVPPSTFTDADIPYGDTLVLAATLADGSALPAWLSFDSVTGTFTGTPGETDAGAIAIRVNATDRMGAETSDTFTLTVDNGAITGTEGADTLTGTAGNDILLGLGGADTLTGGDGHDRLDGGNGADTMIGGNGTDVYIVDDAGDVVVEQTAGGLDTVLAGASHVLAANVENLELTGTGTINGTGNDLANLIFGNEAANTISGNGGNDTLLGLGGNDALAGGAGDDWMDAGDGDDVLDGGTGADSISGGAGNDAYTVDNVGDLVVEQIGGGIDTVNSSISYALLANVENLTLTGANIIDGAGNELDNVLIGNDRRNVLTGGAGNDFLDGGKDADTMLGGTGDDTYVVNTSSDIITENANEGIDTVRTSVSLNLGSNVENLTLTGTGAINGTGNALNNVLTGNSANNTLTGKDGNDTLDGGAGNDTLVGGTGDDIYVVDATGDVVTEGTNSGTDTVLSSVTYTLGNNVENLTVTGTSSINATGNALNNTLTGNSGNNVLTGLGGDDTYRFDLGGGNDAVVDSAGNDTVRFGAGISTGTLNVSRSGDDLSISVGAMDRLTVSGWFLGNRIENFVFDSGTTLGADQIEALIGGQPVNNPPTAATPLGDLGIAEDAAFSFQIPVGTFADPDAGDTLTYAATRTDGATLPAWLGFDASTRTFSGTPANGDVGVVPIRVTVTDSAGAAATDDFSLTVSNVNDAPTVSAPFADQTGVEGTALAFTVPAETFMDVDAGDTLTYSATLADGSVLPAWLAFGPATRNFSGTPGMQDAGSYSIRISATDMTGASASTTFMLAVADVPVNNTPPILANAMADQTTSEDTVFSFQIPAGTFSDADIGDTLSFAATRADGTVLPSWLSFDQATRTLTGIPGNADVGNIELRVTATDGGGASASDTFTLTVTNTNDAPVVVNPVADQLAAEDAPFHLTLPVGEFGDFDAGDTLSYTATAANGSALPAWLTFDPATRTFNGTPGNGDVGTFDVRITASDAGGAAVSDVFALTVANVNDAPIASGAIPDQTTGEGQAFNYTVPAGTFIDVDSGDVLAYSATLSGGSPLPSWLTFQAASRTFAGTPPANAAGSYAIALTATDLAGAGAVSTFTLTVADLLPDNSVVTGTDSTDNLNGTAGDDLISGLAGNDTLSGFAGNDTLDGGTGVDTMLGGTGNDTYVVNTSSDVVTEYANEGIDTVRTSVSLNLGSNVENLTLTGTGAINGTGNTLNNVLTGNTANNTLTGKDGHDTLDGGAGNDILVGATGNDTYLFNRGHGADVVQENDVTAGNTDTVQLGVTGLDTVFTRSGTNLVVSLHGGTDTLAVQNWYSGTRYQTEQIKASDGSTLLNTQVDQLIQAMATFSASHGGVTWDQAIDQNPAEVQAVLAAYWQPAA